MLRNVEFPTTGEKDGKMENPLERISKAVAGLKI